MWVHESMMQSGMMFCEVISKVVSTLLPVDKELALANTVLDPVKTQIHCFGSSLANGAIGNACGTGVVSLDGG